LNLENPNEGIWQVNYNGTMFTSAQNPDGYYNNFEENFVGDGYQSAIINTTSPMIYLPNLEWMSFLKIVSAIPGVDCSEGTFPWSS